MSDTNGAPTVNGAPRFATPDQLARFQELVDNALMARQEFFNKFLDPRRDINDECGYPRTGAITADNLKDLYDRNAIANRVVAVMPKETWQQSPTVYEDEDSENQTKFEEAWDELG